jgi:spore coat protein CotF
MDWRELQEEARMRDIRLLVREEISAALDDLKEVVRTTVGPGYYSPDEVVRMLTKAQTKIKERGTDGTT